MNVNNHIEQTIVSLCNWVQEMTKERATRNANPAEVAAVPEVARAIAELRKTL